MQGKERFLLLVRGYIRHIELVYDVHIPSAIQQLCLLYRGMHSLDSTVILTDFEQQILFDLIGQELIYKSNKTVMDLSLLYRMSRDGNSGPSFHKKCDNQGATVMVMQTEYNHVFGGYAGISWKSDGGHVSDTNAFMFLIRSQFTDNIKISKPESFPLMHKPNMSVTMKNTLGVFHRNACGPGWGSNCSMCVNYGSSKDAFTIGNDSFGFVGNALTGGRYYNPNCDSYYFKIADYEVFKVELK